MTRTRLSIAIVIVLLAALGFSRAETRDQGIPDSEISLRQESVFETTTPSATVEIAAEPGESALHPRPNHVAPPTVPHAISDLLPITSDSNMCVDCHEVEEKLEGEPTPIPASHYTDLRRSPDKVGDELVGARYFCVACHTGLTEAEPLLDNTFAIPPSD